jgi:hypothetical protein
MSWKDSLVVGKQTLPPRVCFFGQHGVGKSTLAAAFPKPIFISTEDGLSSLDVTSFPRAKALGDVANSIGTLAKEKHEFKTVVIDSVDWLVEPLIVADIDSKYDEKAQGYGKGQVYITEAFREILSGLDVLRQKKMMNVVLIAHANIVKFEDPRSEPYDRFTPKLPNRCNQLLQEWVDVLGFCGFRVVIKKDDAGYGNKTTRGVSTGERLIHLVENPAFLAKNRYACPDSVTMTFEQFSSVVPVQQ